MCLSVTTLAATAFIHGRKVRHHRLLYDDLLDFDSLISPKRLRSGDMAVLACLYNRGHQALPLLFIYMHNFYLSEFYVSVLEGESLGGFDHARTPMTHSTSTVSTYISPKE